MSVKIVTEKNSKYLVCVFKDDVSGLVKGINTSSFSFDELMNIDNIQLNIFKNNEDRNILLNLGILCLRTNEGKFHIFDDITLTEEIKDDFDTIDNYMGYTEDNYIIFDYKNRNNSMRDFNKLLERKLEIDIDTPITSIVECENNSNSIKFTVYEY